MNKKAEIVITRWENETFSVSYSGVGSMSDIRQMLHAVEKDARKRKQKALGFDRSMAFSEDEIAPPDKFPVQITDSQP